MESLVKNLARRLEETSQVLHGLKEFIDNLPDAVILTDEEGHILTWNTAAKRLYGRDWDQISYQSVNEVFADPASFGCFLEEAGAGRCLQEQVVGMRHPEKGLRQLSLSMTQLFDRHGNFQGVLTLARDVTAAQQAERRLRRLRLWLIPGMILLVLLAGAAFLGYPRFLAPPPPPLAGQQGVQKLLDRDFLLLHSLLIDQFARHSRARTTPVLQKFLDLPEAGSLNYQGTGAFG